MGEIPVMSWKPQRHCRVSGTRRLFLVPAVEGVFQTGQTGLGDTVTGLSSLASLLQDEKPPQTFFLAKLV